MHPACPRSKGRWVIAGQPSSFRFAPTQLSAMHPHTRQRHLTTFRTLLKGALKQQKIISAAPMQRIIVRAQSDMHHNYVLILLSHAVPIFSV